MVNMLFSTFQDVNINRSEQLMWIIESIFELISVMAENVFNQSFIVQHNPCCVLIILFVMHKCAEPLSVLHANEAGSVPLRDRLPGRG